MSHNPLSTRELDDILADVHEQLEAGASADRIDQIARAHPGVRDEILAFVAEWFASEGSDLRDEDPEVGRTVARHHALLERFWQLVEPSSTNPFEDLPTEDLSALADRCRIDMVILRQLVRGLIDEDTIPGKLVAWIAEGTGAAMADVWSHLTSPMPAAADYYAPGGKRSGKKTSFAEAVRASTLSPENQRFWLNHLDA
jgi:hypothetical protein